MKKTSDPFAQRVYDTIGILAKEREEHPESRAECSYRIVVLSLLSLIESGLSRLRMFLFGLGGFLVGALLAHFFKGG